MLEVEITRLDVASRKVSKLIDHVAEEKPLHILINKTHYATIFCSPLNLKELAFGHLLSTGIVKSIGEIERIKLDSDRMLCDIKLASDFDIQRRLLLLGHNARVIRSGCGSQLSRSAFGRLHKVKSNRVVEAETILSCVNRLNHDAKIFRKTGGVHAAAIFKYNGYLMAFAEDVGRHNAVDKVIGSGLLDNIDFDTCFLALTGRLTSDIVLKAARVGLPIVASLAAAVDSGIAIANDAKLTLVGFVRGKRMNIYTYPNRILL